MLAGRQSIIKPHSLRYPAMSDPTIERKRIIVRGRVQAVGFRLFTHGAATALGVVGSVRNLPDESLEAIAQADAKTMERFLWSLRQGPPMSEVTTLDIEELAPDPTTNSFDILR